MFCYQCEQTFRMTGCVDVGVCGKDPATAGLQDLLIEIAKAVGTEAHAARQAGANLKGADVFVLEALFATGTNVNFDPERLASIVRRGAALVKTQQFPSATAAMLERAALTQIDRRFLTAGPDITGLQELILYGLKGIAAYAEHARQLGKESDSVYASLHEALAFLARPNPTVEELLSMAMKAGELNLRVMELLDAANTGSFGHPEPTEVRVEPRKGKAIVVSGHDLADLRELLEQTAGKSISVYTHGEMLPAHGYPELKKYPHLAGNYGGAWMDQGPEFDAFPGAILMTSNCIQQPRDNYKSRIFTAGPVAWPGVTHIAGRDFTPLIEAALAAPGFEKDGPDTRILVGFGRNAVLGAAGAVIEGVKSGAIRHFFLIGGCDGAKPGRNYYTEFAQSAPRDTIILTLACGKYRFNKLDFGTVAGLPRLLDIGQCNDAYSAIQIAVALANAFGCGVNDLPLSLVLSWYEQKAVAILLTLLHLGIRNIRLGPSLPAFVTPAVLKVLVDNYNILPIQTAEQDLAAILN
jgi:hydroxylamine reductase